jgi:hypothetical protein
MHFVHRIRLFTAVFSIMSLEQVMPPNVIFVYRGRGNLGLA